MKKVFGMLLIAAVFSACGGGSKSGSSDSSATAATTDTSAMAASASRTIDTTQAGGKLIAKNDCLTCHKVDTKVIGPAYADVAKKYTASDAVVDTLANKIIKGGKGNWGEVAMTPHAALSMDDAKTIVKYILTLKK
ncbi:c-type cytochrome [Mucilaginibacter gotjawali]|uniref:Cytochrome c-552 n=2 Tax=Mucilaginibacter gotjawali TaxID=1550579 RepID=A0A0X8X3N4_9SPHI|nr:c-type cytochrome [Mucilaginibacter gotjawali]MBB3056419.1 cytochrome c [Mucilaginibacter gotjawali]BAU55125.1 Cytochrome c-552 precursor [Mucilaginibacter gotjawali]